MKTVLRKIFCAGILSALLLGGCTRQDELRDEGDSKGYAQVNFKLSAPMGKTFVTRAYDPNDPDDLLNIIDDVHLLIFEASGDDGQGNKILLDTDPVYVRNYYKYGEEQNIYLQKGTSYFVYVLANMDASNCPSGNVATFFDNIVNYAGLKEKYVQFLERTPEQTGKVIMATDEPIEITLPTGVSEYFEPVLTLQRLQTQFIVNIYNKVTGENNRTIISGVYPSTIGAFNLPRYSYVMDHNEDYPFVAIDEENRQDGYMNMRFDLLPEPETNLVEIDGNWYTKRTVTYYSFENRRGSVPGINNFNATTYYDPETDTDVTETHNKPVYGRRELAPAYATNVQIISLTEGNSLRTYIHAGQGRDTEEIYVEEGDDDITNFDVDRNCIYYCNVIINGINDVRLDTRRELLNQVVLFTFPDVSRIDAHFMDIPTYMQTRMNGYAKLEAGTGDEDAVDEYGEIQYNGTIPKGWTAMPNESQEQGWLRFSWTNPYNQLKMPNNAINTTLYVNMNSSSNRQDADAFTGATPILHFHENLSDPMAAYQSNGNPNRRWAIIRVGFVEDAASAAEYETNINDEVVFYIPVSQYGLKTIGQVGGYNGSYYSSMLGVESVEEYTYVFYNATLPNADPEKVDQVVNGPFWRYRPGNAFVNHNQAYDGLTATKEHYADFSNLFNDAIPPVLWDPRSTAAYFDTTIPLYNPVSNTNAADYCVRKNRDTNGNGVIDAEEILWYLPTPVQAQQMYSWRTAFRYSINGSYSPFGGEAKSNYYWTTNENESTNTTAFAMDFSQQWAQTRNEAKTTRYPVRCVRDVPGTLDQSMFYYADGHMAANLTGHFPESSITDGKSSWGDTDLRDPAKNSYGRAFLVSRWYSMPNNTTHAGTPTPTFGNNGHLCSSYQEPGYPAGSWVLASQLELSLINAYSGMIEDLFDQAGQTGLLGTYPTGAVGANTYHKFINTAVGSYSPIHWGYTNSSNDNANWLTINFASGETEITKKNQVRAYFRCIRYLDTPL